MPLTVVLGAPVPPNAVVDGHSTTNGAAIPDTATVTFTSSDVTVATVPATFTVPAGGAKELIVPVTPVAVGTTTISVSVVVGTATFPASDTLTVTAAAPALDHVTLTLAAA